MEDLLTSQDCVSDADIVKRRVSVRTNKGASIAKKFAMLKLLDLKISGVELTTSTISVVPGSADVRLYVYRW